MKYWGITGTNGKTTTTWITAAFIDAMPGRKCGYVTTVEVFDGAKRFYTGYTTPPLAQLKEIFASMEANGCTDCVMEVSSHAIHQHRTGDTVFSGGAFTNLSEDHLDYHKTMEAYFDVKLDFARQIAAAHHAAPDAGRRDLPPYVVCLDGGYGREMFNAVGNLAVNVIGVSRGSEGLTRGTGETRGARGEAGTGGTEKRRYDLSGLQLAGDYNQSNVLVAAALAEAAGVSREAIQAVIPTLKPRWGRLELVENPNVKATVYVDFAHTPDGLEKVLGAVRGEMEREDERDKSDAGDERRETRGTIGTRDAQPTAASHQPLTTNHSHLWVVFGAGGDRDPMKRPLMGEACARLADRLVVTSDNPRSEDPLKIIDAILVGVNTGLAAKGDATFLSREPESSTVKGDATFLSREKGEATASVFVEPDRAKAIAYALSHAAAGDVVVIAGKGHETTQEIKGVRHPFDDREVVRAYGNPPGMV